MAIIDKPSDHFNTVLYTGNGTSQSITGIEFAPKFTWIKDRTSAGTAHILFDIIRGATYRLNSNTTNSEFSIVQSLTAFNSDGFSVGSYSEANTSGNSFVSWNWRGSDSSAVSNTSGSITSTVSANTTSGFSIVSWTADGGNATTVGHGLGSTPKIVIYKDRGSGTWYVLYTFVDGSQDYLVLNGTNASAGLDSATYGTATSTTISNIGFTNGNNMIAYCFAEKQGFSKFGSYTGNGSTDGTFIYTGFKPAFFVVKPYSTTGNWYCWDSKRSPINQIDGKYLELDASSAEVSTSSVVDLDFLSTGVKLRNTGGGFNGSGVSFIYMAFAEQPFVTSTANGSIPATAR
jgi:hypothetical protein